MTDDPNYYIGTDFKIAVGLWPKDSSKEHIDVDDLRPFEVTPELYEKYIEMYGIYSNLTQDMKRSTSGSNTLNLQKPWNLAISTVPAFIPSILPQLIRLDIESVFSHILPFSRSASRICKTLKPLVLLGSSDNVLGCGGRT